MRGQGALDIATVPVARLSSPEWDEVWALAQEFMDTTREVFEGSLRSKDACVLIRDRVTRALLGIGGIAVHEARHEGRAQRLIFVGNTFFRDGLRGQSLIQRLGFETFLRTRLKHPLDDIWLCFDTYSYKSYLMLPRNFVTFWPRRDQPTPSWVQELLESFARVHYGGAWDPERGIVRGDPRRRLREGVASVDEALLTDPDIRFFVEKNPGYARGDQLPVLVPLNASNWMAVAGNAVRRARQRRQRVGAST